MKKLLVLILIALLIILCAYTALQGLNIGGVEILGFQGIKARSDQLDQRIELAARRAQTDYPKALSIVKSNTKKLQEQKEAYEEMTEFSSGEDLEAANQVEKYEYDSLMVKLGRHATTNGASLNINVEKGNTTGVYNLKFEAEGRYIAILDFISAIENDSTLGFKIEDFEMTPVTSGASDDTEQRVKGTFTCRTIAIEKIGGQVSKPSVPTVTEGGTEEGADATNTTATNTTNTTNTTKSTNSTSTNKTTNTTNSTKK